MLTQLQLREFAPSIPIQDLSSVTDGFNNACAEFGISTQRRQRYFLTQTSFETQGFTKFKEDLYYTTPKRIAEVWPTRFYCMLEAEEDTGRPNIGELGKARKVGRGPLNAELYIRSSEKLANAVYSNRMGNGDEESGDGWLYIGRGPTHLTGAFNYKMASNAIFKDFRLLDHPELVEKLEVGFLTAGWFWKTNGLNELADKDEFTKVTSIVNGSDATVKLRLAVLKRANRLAL